MKETNIGSPVEADVRAHFGNLLHSDKEIEIVPHTKIWATKDGTLLWDPKNGFADLGVKRETAETKHIVVGDGDGLKVVKRSTGLKRVILLTGPQGSGKTTLVNLMDDAIELNRGEYIGFTDLSRSIDKHARFETVAICTNDLRPQAFNLDNALRIWCRERKLIYLNINLTIRTNGN